MHRTRRLFDPSLSPLQDRDQGGGPEHPTGPPRQRSPVLCSRGPPLLRLPPHVRACFFFLTTGSCLTDVYTACRSYNKLLATSQDTTAPPPTELAKLSGRPAGQGTGDLEGDQQPLFQRQQQREEGHAEQPPGGAAGGVVSPDSQTALVEHVARRIWRGLATRESRCSLCATPPHSTGSPTHPSTCPRAVFVNFWVTLSIFPGVLAEDAKHDALGDWLGILLIGCFNLFDFVGKMAPLLWLVRKPEHLSALAAGRVLFLPAYLVSVRSGAGLGGLGLLTALFGATNGYVASASFMLFPLGLRGKEAEAAGTLLVLSLLLGLTVGAMTGWLWVLSG